MLSKALGAGKWKGVTVAVKIVEHSAETEGELLQLRESLLSSSIVHPNVVSLSYISMACQIPRNGSVALRHCSHYGYLPCMKLSEVI